MEPTKGAKLLRLLAEIFGTFSQYRMQGPIVDPPIQANFDTCSQCNSDSLSRDGLRKLLDEQLPNYLKCPGDPKEFDELFKRLDQNCDQQISFEEFTELIREILITMFEKRRSEDGDGDAHHP